MKRKPSREPKHDIEAVEVVDEEPVSAPPPAPSGSPDDVDTPDPVSPVPHTPDTPVKAPRRKRSDVGTKRKPYAKRKPKETLDAPEEESYNRDASFSPTFDFIKRNR